MFINCGDALAGRTLPFSLLPVLGRSGSLAA
jgi:hypothetical protein